MSRRGPLPETTPRDVIESVISRYSPSIYASIRPRRGGIPGDAILAQSAEQRVLLTALRSDDVSKFSDHVLHILTYHNKRTVYWNGEQRRGRYNVLERDLCVLCGRYAEHGHGRVRLCDTHGSDY